jgi:hypothetical protein
VGGGRLGGGLAKPPSPSFKQNRDRGGGLTAWLVRPASVIAGALGSAAAGGRGNGAEDACYLFRRSPWSGASCGGGSAARNGQRRRLAAMVQMAAVVEQGSAAGDQWWGEGRRGGLGAIYRRLEVV